MDSLISQLFWLWVSGHGLLYWWVLVTLLLNRTPKDLVLAMMKIYVLYYDLFLPFMS